jgi:hypothetical protein
LALGLLVVGVAITIDRRMIDGVERAPRLSDYDRWRRVVQQITS